MYHESRQACDAFVRECRAQHDSIYNAYTRFEPDHGWLAQLYTWHFIPSLEGKAEQVVAGGAYHGGTTHQVPRKPPISPRTTPEKGGRGGTLPKTGDGTTGPVQAPSKGATKRVWDIADRVFAEVGHIDRAKIIEACVAEGINASTAGTQFSKWRKGKA